MRKHLLPMTIFILGLFLLLVGFQKVMKEYYLVIKEDFEFKLAITQRGNNDFVPLTAEIGKISKAKLAEKDNIYYLVVAGEEEKVKQFNLLTKKTSAIEEEELANKFTNGVEVKVEEKTLIPDTNYYAFIQNNELRVLDQETNAIFETGIIGENFILILPKNREMMAVICTNNGRKSLNFYSIRDMRFIEGASLEANDISGSWNKQGSRFLVSLQKEKVSLGYEISFPNKFQEELVFQRDGKFKLFWAEGE